MSTKQTNWSNIHATVSFLLCIVKRRCVCWFTTSQGKWIGTHNTAMQMMIEVTCIYRYILPTVFDLLLIRSLSLPKSFTCIQHSVNRNIDAPRYHFVARFCKHWNVICHDTKQVKVCAKQSAHTRRARKRGRRNNTCGMIVHLA